MNRKITQIKKLISRSLGIGLVSWAMTAASLNAQTVLINPAGDGGFQNGSTFAANGWSVSNSANNPWVVGTAITTTPIAGNSAYISNTSGTSASYATGSSALNYFWRDVSVPAGESIIRLSLNWSQQGESTWDLWQVFTAPTTLTPVGITTHPGSGLTNVPAGIAAATFVGNGQITTGVQSSSFILPASLAGTTFRLIFAWKNDGGGGTQPPAVLDNISLTSQALSLVPSSGGTFTIDNTLPTGTGNFNNFSDAIFNLNIQSSPLTGPVVFNVSSNQTFYENNLSITKSGDAINTITFQKNGLGANPNISTAGSSASSDFAIALNGSDYITFDGIDISASSSNVEYGYLIKNASATNGAMFNNIKNCNITLNRTNTSSRAILQSATTTASGFAATSSAGANSNNKYQNLTIRNVYSGIELLGTSGFPDTACQIGTTSPSIYNSIGNPQVNNDLGGNLSTSSFGISISNSSNVQIYNNNINSIGINSTSITADGIIVLAFQGNNNAIYNNTIAGIRNASTSNTSVISGLRITNATSGSNAIAVYNNVIRDLTSGYTSTATGTRIIRGINLTSTGVGTSTNYFIYYNTVLVNTSGSLNISSSCIDLAPTSATSPIYNIRNNVFVNATPAQTGTAKHYVVYTGQTTAIGNAASISNNNILRVENTTNGFIGLTNTTDRTTLSDWQTAISKDANSSINNPNFNSSITLIPYTGSTIVGLGTPLASPYNIDILGTNRGLTNTTPGAYENAGDFAPPVISYGSLSSHLISNTTRILSSFATITDLAGVSQATGLSPRIYYKKTTEANAFGANNNTFNGWKWTTATNTTSPFSFTIDYALLNSALLSSDTIVYFIVAQDSNGNVGSNPSIGFTSTSVAAVTTAPSSPSFYPILGLPMSGSYTVGTGGTYTTLTKAINDINLRSLQGNVNLQFISNTTEPSPVSIIQWTETGAGNYTLSITTSAVDTLFANGANTGAITLQGADRVIFDGRIGGIGNNLTIVNTNTATGSSSILVASNGTNAGAENNTIRNLNLLTGDNSVSTTGISVTGDNNNNLTISNNIIKRAQIGINVSTTNYPSGANTGLNISGNTIGDVLNTLNVNTGGINISNSPQATIAQNRIYNVNSTASTNNYGIQIGSNASKTSIIGNRIDTVTNASSSGYGAYGINITGSDTLTIANNIVTRIAIYNYSATSTIYNPFGIRITAGSGHRIYYNTVNLFGSSLGAGTAGTLSAALLITGGTNLDIRNNIFVNSYVGLTGSQSFAVYNNATTPFAIINNNNYFVAGTYGVLGFSTSNRTTIADWKTATAQDASSISTNPSFTNNTDVNINSGATANQMESAGATLAVTTDFNGDSRPKTIPTSFGGNTAPDMGAIEFDGQPIDLIPPTITYTNLANTSLLTNRSLTATITDLQSSVDSTGNAPRVYFKKSTDANVFGGNTAGDNGWKYTSATKSGNNYTANIDYAIINGGSVAINDTVQYFVVAQDLATVPNVIANPLTGFTGTNVGLITAAPTNPNRYIIVGTPLAGTYTVGITGDFTTITGAINNLNSRGISAPVTFELIDANYSVNETFPVIINQLSGSSNTNIVTIKPATANTAIITGKSLTSIFKFNGADFVTIDGSNNGTNSRNLTIINDSNTTAGSAVIWLASAASNDGANNNIIKNCTLQGRDSATTEIVIFSGGTAGIGAGSFNALTNNNNNIIQNNIIQRAKYGIWLKGTSTTVLDSNNRIINNQLGLATSNGFSSGGVVIQFQKNGLVQKNNVRGVRGTGGLVNAGGSSTIITALYLRQCINTTINANSISAFNYTGTGANRSHVLYVESPAFNTSGSPSNNIISNNSIFDARVSSTGPSFWTITGLSLNGGYGDKIYFNSVNLTGVVNVTAGPAAAFSNGNAEQTTLTSTIDLRNNIFVINGSSTTTATFYSNYWQSAGYAGSTLNYNLLRSVSTATATANIGYNGSAQATIAAWKTATSQEANSITADPLFASNNVLIPGLGSPVVAAGVAITNFTLDIVDSVRSNPPTIGAYDKAIDVSGPIITYNNLTNINQLTNRTVTGFATITDVSTVDVGSNKPRLYFRKASDANALGTYPADNNSSFNGWKYVEASNTTSPFNFTIDYSLLLGGAGVNINDTILYFVVAQDALGNVSSNPSAGFTATSVGTITAAPTIPNGYLIVDVPMAGSYTVGVSGNYPNLNSAVFALNTRGAQGDVNFDIISNITEPATVVIPQWTETGAGNYKLRISPTVTDTIFANSANSGAIVLFGADRVTIDGRIGGTGNNLTIVNTNTAAISVGVLVASAGTGLGCVNDSIVNVNILAGTNTANAIGIQAQGDNNNNLVIQNNVIKRAQIGINVFTTNYPAGANTGLNISGNIIGDVSNTLNVNIGGINIANSPQATIAQNRIYNVNIINSTNNYGIQIGSNSSKSTIIGNRIDTVTNASTGGWGAFGINVTGSDTLTIANNIVTRMAIYNYSTSSTFNNPFGIRITAGSGHRIYFNTVNLFGSSLGAGANGTLSAALLVTGGTNLDIRNNIFANNYVGLTGSQSFAVYSTATTPFAIINNNDYYATGIYGVLGYYTTNRTTLAAWKTATAQDASSISANPSFTSNTDVNINSGATANQMESAGATLAVTTDFNGDPRPKTIPTSFGGNTFPDMGAIEFDGQPIDLIPPTITYTNLTNTSLLTNRSLTATITDLQSGIDSIGNSPRVYFKKTTDANTFGGNTAGDNGWKYTSATKSGNNFTATIDYSIINTGVVNVNDTIQYFVVAQDLATVPNVIANPSTGFVATSVSSITAAPTTPNYYVVTAAPLAGNYTVGAGGNFITLTDAVNNLNLRGVSANVTFELTDATYTTPAETFPLTINQISGASASNRFTIKPSSGNTTTITGSNALSIIKLNGADYVTIDGSNNGTTTKDLTITNSSNTANSATIWLASLGANSGATNNKIQNTIINGASTATVSVFGIYSSGNTISNTTNGEDNDTLTIDNNEFNMLGVGIYLAGTSSNTHDMLTITNNTIGNANLANTVVSLGIYALRVNGLVIANNSIKNIVGANTGSPINSDGTEGILLESGVLNATITKNTVDNVAYTGTGGYGGKGIDINTGIANSNIEVTNNMVSNIMGDGWSALGTDAIVGIRILGTTGNVRLYHNTVHLTGTANRASATVSAAVYAAAGVTNLNVRNNIFMNGIVNNTTASKAFAAGTDITNPATITINYNNYFVYGTQGIFGYLGGDVASLTAWKAAIGQDANSINDSTRFVSLTNLHLTSTSIGNFSMKAAPISGVNTDIDNQARTAPFYYMGADEIPSSPLPVKLTSLTANVKENNVLVSWTTASEVNNKGFEVERSIDGTEFASITFVKGAGNSSNVNSYSKLDLNAFNVTASNTIYYRLKQVDFDGKYTYSQIVKVYKNLEAFSAVAIYPNPFVSQVTVSFNAATQSTAVIEILDIQGKVVATKTANTVNGANTVEVNNTDNLQAGIYFARLTLNGESQVIKLVKTN
ncbi:MAG: T9SS type A sorting domain-containing protein [Bacteroidota bacterium]